MKSKELLKRLIDELEEFNATNTALSERNFALYLLSKHHTEQPNRFETESVHSDILNFVIRLNKYANGYLKLALQDSRLRNIDEISCLIFLNYNGTAPKHQLIEELLLEYTTGNEIIKRLERYNWVTTTQHPTDKRSRVVAITEAGQQELFRVFESLQQLSQLVTGRLDNKEMELLHHLLERLNHYHLKARPSYKSSASFAGFIEHLNGI